MGLGGSKPRALLASRPAGYHNVRWANGDWNGANVADGNGSILDVAAATTPNGDMHLAVIIP